MFKTKPSLCIAMMERAQCPKSKIKSKCCMRVIGGILTVLLSLKCLAIICAMLALTDDHSIKACLTRRLVSLRPNPPSNETMPDHAQVQLVMKEEELAGQLMRGIFAIRIMILFMGMAGALFCMRSLLITLIIAIAAEMILLPRLCSFDEDFMPQYRLILYYSTHTLIIILSIAQIATIFMVKSLPPIFARKVSYSPRARENKYRPSSLTDV